MKQRIPEQELRAVPSGWPALIALAVVAMLALAELVFDVVQGTKYHREASYMVENSLRSVTLVDDLRYQAARLLAAHGDTTQVGVAVAQIDADLRSYEPLASEDGEREELDQLRPLLDQFQRGGSTEPTLAAIEASIDRIVEINQRAATRNAELIRAGHDRELAADIIVGAITLVLAIAVGIVLVRALRRQRALLHVHLSSMTEQQKELEAFAARASHDLMGPRSPLRGYADLLSMHDAADVRELAMRIRRASDRMTGIIDELLALSHGTPPTGRVALAPVIREILDELAPELASADVDVAVGELAALCSPGALGQIARNLLTNSIKYRSPDRKLEIRVEAARAQEQVVIEFADNGIGMESDAVAHAFEPNYRAPGASAPGHGLGLSIVKRAVESLGGSCALQSTKGEGTRVVVRLRAG